MRYPLGVYEKDRIVSRTGKKLEDINLTAVLDNRLTAEDIKISEETLKIQGQVAKDAGNSAMQMNFERAAELVDVPDEVVLKMYDKLRPNRATKQELLQLVKELEETYKAEQTAKLVKEAAEIYEKRGILL